MPNLSPMGENSTWVLPSGPDTPWDEDVSLALRAGYSSSEISDALTVRSRASGNPTRALSELEDDFFEYNDLRKRIVEDPVATHPFMDLASRIVDDYVYQFLKAPLICQPWDEAKRLRSLVTKDSSGGYFFGQVLNTKTEREAIIAEYNGKVPLFMLAPHSFVPRKTDENVWSIANSAAKSLWSHLYLDGTKQGVERFLNYYGAETCFQMWWAMLRSRRALSKNPKIRSVYDAAFASNEFLARTSSPTNLYFKS